MNELEQAFEEAALEEDAKLTEMLSENTKETPAEAETNQEQEDTNETEESTESVKTPVQMPAAHGGARTMSWERQLKELSEFTGEGVYGLESMRKLPNFPEMHRLMSKGATALEAYKTVNFDSILRTQVQKERNKIRAKAHLKASGGGADANEVVVPNDVYRAFKMLEPKMSDEEIRQYYKKTRNG